MGANPHANGGLLLRDLVMPDFREYAVDVPKPGGVEGEATRVLGKFLRDVMRANERDRKSTRLNSSHLVISYAVFCLKKKKKKHIRVTSRKYEAKKHASARSDNTQQ